MGLGVTWSDWGHEEVSKIKDSENPEAEMSLVSLRDEKPMWLKP